jgi:hypothetical protein
MSPWRGRVRLVGLALQRCVSMPRVSNKPRDFTGQRRTMQGEVATPPAPNTHASPLTESSLLTTADSTLNDDAACDAHGNPTIRHVEGSGDATGTVAPEVIVNNVGEEEEGEERGGGWRLRYYGQEKPCSSLGRLRVYGSHPCLRRGQGEETGSIPGKARALWGRMPNRQYNMCGRAACNINGLRPCHT